MENNPKVFISYAHKNQVYEDKVLELANRLRSEGIDAMTQVSAHFLQLLRLNCQHMVTQYRNKERYKGLVLVNA